MACKLHLNKCLNVQSQSFPVDLSTILFDVAFPFQSLSASTRLTL
jgi:hypothetical protein